MFAGMFARKPDKAAAMKKLKEHVLIFGVCVAVIRATPYVLHYLSGEKDEFKLEL
uniref:Mitochondrial import receptor subunit TOM6 homolog n=1 Tax=Kalanchoe fedtschenkoi TaxID=63787 RepID=A0A7N0T1W9_KALFE